jgi:formate--tetrahydrofolate ligase
MKSDIEIAQAVKLKPIKDVAESIGIEEKYLEYYGHTKAKINLDIGKKLESKKMKIGFGDGQTPTPAGEGKTTTTVGLGQALWS